MGAFRESLGKATRAAAILSVTLAAGCGQDRADATAKAKPDAPKAVRLVTAEAGNLPRVVTVTGTLAAEDQVVLNTEVAGRLDELPVDLGSIVHEGDVVAVLDLTDFLLKVEQAETALAQARARLGVPVDGSGDAIQPEKTSLVRQARAVLDQARRQRERMTTLHGEGILAKAELDQVDADYRVAEARLQEAFDEVRNRQAIVAERRAAVALARQQLADDTLRAPFDGAVRERQVSVGAYLDVGAAVVKIVRMHPLRLRLAVPERDAGSLRVEQRVRLREEGTGTPAEGTIVRLSPAVDEGTRTLMVEAEIPNQDGTLRPGAFATADIVVDPEQTAILVPASAIVTFAGVTKVVTVADGKAVEKRVQLGRKAGDRVEVTSGLAAGESVVAEPGSLSAGQAVVVE